MIQDIATAHISAITSPEASGQRFIICGGQISSQQISDILRKDISQLADRTPEGTPGKDGLGENAFICSSEKAKKFLELTFRSKEETFVDLAKQLLHIEGQEAI
jgi:nucleoside-diphosphate-sugar epimerase